MPLASPGNMPTSSLTMAFRATEEVLRRDEELRRLPIKWRVWDGSPEDVQEMTLASMPMIRLSPGPNSGMGWASVDEYEFDLMVQLELAVAGTKIDHLFNLWELVAKALRGDKPFRDDTVRRFMQNEGAAVVYKLNGLRMVATTAEAGAYLSSFSDLTIKVFIGG